MSGLITAFSAAGATLGFVGGLVAAGPIASIGTSLSRQSSNGPAPVIAYAAAVLVTTGLGFGAGKGIDWIIDKATTPDPVTSCVENTPANSAVRIETRPDGSISCVYTPA